MGKMKEVLHDVSISKKCDYCGKFMKTLYRFKVSIESKNERDPFVVNFMFCSNYCIVEKTLKVLRTCEGDPMEVTIIDYSSPISLFETYTGEEFEEEFA
jgi:hypothetical protein